MLYISRPIASIQYGVVDTDDGTESVVTFAEITEIVTGLLIHIEGAVTGFSAHGGLAIRRIECYQDEQYVTREVLKAKMLLGVEVRLFRNEITYISVCKTGFRDNTRLRLSDYASRISGRVGVHYASAAMGLKNTLVLVLDDNIEVLTEAFDPIVRGVKYDIREYTNEKVISSMYKALGRRGVAEAHWCGYIVDTPEQREKYKRDGIVALTAINSWRAENGALH